MDSSVVSDPRFKILGKRLNVSWRDAIGTCFLVWLACYERRSERMTPDEIDVVAETEAFASAMVSVGLAHYSADQKTVIVHGVTARIKFLKQQSARGKNGGKASGQIRRKAFRVEGIGNEANAEANASGTAQAYSPALAQALPQSPAPAQKTKTEEGVRPTPDPKPKFDPIAAPLPFGGEAFRAAWESWIAYRRERRLSLAEKYILAQLDGFKRFGPDAVIWAIAESISQGWQGVFPEKYPGARPGSDRGRQDMLDFINAEAPS